MSQAPLVPANVDLRDFGYMPVDIRRLLTSETWLTATGDEKAAAMTLWLESWHQVPAGSLPDNDRMLAVLSQSGARWKKVRAAALRGWRLCSDGRLYHPVVCEKALEAWDKKHAQRKRTAAARAARRHRADSEDATEHVTSSVTENVTGLSKTTVTGSKGKGEGIEDPGSSSLRSSDPATGPSELNGTDEAIWRHGLAWLSRSGVAEARARSVLGKLRKQAGDENLAEVIWRGMAEKPIEPVAWLEAALKPKKRGFVV
jgi:uncharacterized protein YdaU (DUF1376 family)